MGKCSFDAFAFSLLNYFTVSLSTLQRQPVIDDLPAILFTGFETSREPVDSGFGIVVKLYRRPVLARIDTTDGRAVARHFEAKQSNHAVLFQNGRSRQDLFVIDLVKILKSFDLVVEIIFEIEVGFELKFVVHFVVMLTRRGYTVRSESTIRFEKLDIPAISPLSSVVRHRLPGC
jgi:hypothetical protein